MAKTVVSLPLPTQHLGTTRSITVHRYGSPAARPKAYIQAGLHADEIPGMLCAHHLPPAGTGPRPRPRGGVS